MRQANYIIVYDGPDRIVIRDVGPWNQFLTVTNDPEDVVFDLSAAGKLPAGKMLLCIDSEGETGELQHDGNGKFMGFAPGPSED